MSRLEVQAGLAQALDTSGFPVDVLQVTAHNQGSKRATLIGCAVLLPLGLRIYPDPPALDYPFDLDAGATCADRLDCVRVAKLTRESDYRGKVRLVAMFLEAGGSDEALPGFAPAYVLSGLLSAPGTEHRSDPFDFDLDRWM